MTRSIVQVMKKIATYDNEKTNYRHFGDVLDVDTINQYLCAVKTLLLKQRSAGLTSLKSDDIMTERMKVLLKEVRTRRNAVVRALFKERISKEFQPFKMIVEVPRIEEWLWEYNNTTISFAASSLRDRFHFLMSLGAVLRSESLFKADLSDLCDVMLDTDKTNEPSPYHIVVLCIGEGKENNDKHIFGRIMRHWDPRLCGIGGLAMYLMLRFQLTKEPEMFDFLINDSWFNTKLIHNMSRRKRKNPCNTTNESNTDTNVDTNECWKIMNKGVYTKKVTNCLKALGIASRKKEHIRRDTAPAIMDLEEVCGLDQRNMGNWSADVFQKSYSKRLPLGALRALAGFPKEKGKYRSARTTFQGEHQHQVFAKKIFPCADAIVGDNEINNHKTSKAFLVFLRNMRWVILQDATILIKVHGRTHCLFNTFPHIFKSTLFADYGDKLLRHMDDAIEPNDIDIEKVLPGVLQKFERQHECMNEIKDNIATLGRTMSHDVISTDVSASMRAELKLFSQHIGNAISSYATQDHTNMTTQSLAHE